MTIARFHNVLLLVIVSLYLLLNYGFMQVRVPPVGGGGIPVGELTLLFSLAIINYSKLLPRLSATIFLAPFLIWWMLGLGRAVAGVPEYGLWALRDASHVIESLFLIVGFAFAARPQALEQFFNWLPKILILVCIYALSFPFAEALKPLSPELIAGGGQEVSLFFNYVGTSTILLMAAAYLTLFERRTGIGSIASITMIALLLGYTVFFFQVRTNYLQILALLLLLVLFRREAFGKGIFVVYLLVAALMLIPLIGLQFEGRLGQAVSVEFLSNHFLSIGGVESEGLEGSAGGVGQRLGWWFDLYDRWTESIGTFLFGLGYGFPLIDFVAYGAGYAESGQVVREPHNSYISILSRVGLVGAFAFVWMHVVLIGVWRRAYKVCTSIRWRGGQNRLLILMVFFILIWVFAIGEDAFEKPFFTIPYYFFWGIVLQMSRQLKHIHYGRGTDENADKSRGQKKLLQARQVS